MSLDRQVVATALLVLLCGAWSGCEDGRSVSPRSRSVQDAGAPATDVPVSINCGANEDCPANLPICVAGRCSPGGDSGSEDDAGDRSDAGSDAATGPTPGELCGLCQGRDDECGGEENLCVPYSNGQSYCAQRCGDDAVCPSGFVCLNSFTPPQCMPRAQRCVENCAVDGCAGEGEICDPSSGACRTPKGHCEPCSESSECGLGLCVTLNDGQKYCLAGCAAAGQVQCPEATTCQQVTGLDGVACVPESNECDLCGGVACEEGELCAAGECVQCLADSDCAQGVEVCINRRCEPGAGGGGCRSDQECEGDPGGNYCSGGRCVGCVVDGDCPPRNRCTASQCESAPCLGVECVAPLRCDPDNGRCVGEDGRSCPELPCPEGQLCDAQTGQCYNEDGTCDAGSPCRPGSICGGGGGGLPLPGAGGAEETRCSCPIPGPIGCTTDQECTSPFRCRETEFGASVCGDPCAGDNDCPEAWTCRLDFPVGCDSGATYCHPGQSCNAFTGACE